MRRIFLLSPANLSGVRAGYLLNPRATFALAREFHRAGLPLGEVFAFASGLYFRGKLAYARQFSSARRALVRVITTNAGLVDPARIVTPAHVREFGAGAIDLGDPRYHGPLRRDAAELASRLGRRGSAVLLGSIATAKYRDVLLEAFGDRLYFPADFVGRGDMSRGALLLRAARAGTELAYLPVAGAVFHGTRAPSWHQSHPGLREAGEPIWAAARRRKRS
ncbi:MAG TPA: hypothetical protein VHV47_15635 [Opitutaceae bacterium]|jgi:hypothetical protein|nr:hypothetical protein [Opitutaceae bacterium]